MTTLWHIVEDVLDKLTGTISTQALCREPFDLATAKDKRAVKDLKKKGAEFPGLCRRCKVRLI